MEIQFDDLDNLFETTLDGDLTETATTINLVDVPANTSEGFLAIDADDKTKIEFVHFNAKGAGFVSVPASGGRGQGGTAVQEHSSGAVVRMYVMREHIKPLLDKVSSLESEIEDGWILLDKESDGTALTWTAIDTNTISVSSDLTGILQKGDKIKLTNNSAVKYFYVMTTPVFGTNTTFDVTGEVDLVAGEITLPYFSKILNPQGMIDGTIKYKCSVSKSGQLNIGQNVDARILYNTELFDTGNNFDAVTNNVFYAPVSGYYNVYAIVTWLTLLIGENVAVFIKINGTNALSKAINIATSTYGLDMNVGGLIYLTKGQYIEVTSKHDGAHATADIEFSRLTVSFVSV